MRLIDADEMLKRLEVWNTNDYMDRALYNFTFNRIMEQPTIEERKTGKWIYGEHDIAMCDGYRCDKCGFFVPWDYRFTFIDFINDYHFCPNCGADMRGEQDD